MATGDQSDVYTRLSRFLPRTWFGDLAAAPLISAVLTGFAKAHSYTYSLITYAALQLRIATATDGWLDMIAADFFGATFYRHAGQSDASFRTAIILNLFRPRGTRAAVIKAITDMTGIAPVLVEFNRPTDTGVYGGPYIGYGLAGAYGSLVMPMQAMVTAFRPATLAAAPLGYIPTDAEIAAAVEAVRPAGYTVWVVVKNQVPLAYLGSTFVLGTSQLQ